jgi:hypothetical protein
MREMLHPFSRAVVTLHFKITAELAELAETLWFCVFGALGG